MRKYFGTDGIRRIANTELSPELVFRVAKAGAYVLSKHTDHMPTILIGRDTRISGTLIESSMISGFLSYGANVKTLGVLPTPAVAYLTKKLNADASVVISASHNTYEFNGVKYFSNKGMKIPDSIEEEIEEVMDSDKMSELVAVNENIGISESGEELVYEYIYFIEGIFRDSLLKNANKDFKVVIDTANGATSQIAEKIFSDLGINFTIINNKPNGVNINDNCGSTHLEGLRKYVLENGYDLGIAYDGDGDRCLAIDENGDLIDGDKILAVSSKYLKENNVWIYGTDMETEKMYYDEDLTGNVAIVIGSEGFGMSRLVKENCDFLIKIPMKGKITSLNASVSAGIVMYEAVKQRMK